MKYFISLLIALSAFGCNQNYEYGKNIGDIYSKEGQFYYLLLRSFSWGGSDSSSAQPRQIFSYSDRIILSGESYSSTAPYIWVSTDGTTFTKYSVKLGDCVGTSGTNNYGCIISYVGYENGTYAVFGYKTQNSTGSSSTMANYFGKGADLSSITVNSTSPGATIGYNSPTIFSSGKFHASKSGTTNSIYSTTDGTSWTSVTTTNSCNSMYLADSGTLACSLANYYNGTTWATAGTITGGGGIIFSYAYTTYMDGVFRSWTNSSGTLKIFKSTSGAIATGVTFPASPDSSVTMSSSIMNPQKIYKTSGGVYLTYASYTSNSGTTTDWIKSSDGASWSKISPTFPTDLGTLSSIYGLGALGNNFYAIASFKTSSNFTNTYLLQSADGQTWTKVDL